MLCVWHLPIGLIFLLEGVDLKRTSQPFPQSQNREFGKLKYIFGNLFYKHVGHGHIVTFCICVNSPLVIEYRRTAPMYPSGGLCPWLLPWGWYAEVVVSILQVLSTEVTLLIKSRYFCLLQETNITFVCLCTFFQPRPRSAVTCNCHCLGKPEHRISGKLAFVRFPSQINELWRNTAFDVCTNGIKLSAFLNSKNS